MDIEVVLKKIVHRFKYYVFINGLIWLVSVVTYSVCNGEFRYATYSSLFAFYVAAIIRQSFFVLWFTYVSSFKPMIYGDQRKSIQRKDNLKIIGRMLTVSAFSDAMGMRLGVSIMNPTASLPIWNSLSWSFLYNYHIFCSYLYDYGIFILKSLKFEIVFDLVHYIAHRLCHEFPTLYRRIHKRHHRHPHPSPLSTFEQDFGDLILTNIFPFVVASYFTNSISERQLHLLLAYKTFVEVAGHSGIEMKGKSFPQMPFVEYIFGMCLDVQDHGLHHINSKCNFSKRFKLWDVVFGTYVRQNTE